MLSDMPVLANLKTKLRWHQQRQGVLAQNVANADTPDYQARELRAPKFGDAVRVAALGVAQTDNQHIGGKGPGAASASVDRKTDSWEITPEGNGVVLEEQMMKVTENQMDFRSHPVSTAAPWACCGLPQPVNADALKE